MDFQARQNTLDTIKWYDSIVAGEDRCGTYAFCVKCRKNEQYPCAKAEDRYGKGYVRVGVLVRRS